MIKGQVRLAARRCNQFFATDLHSILLQLLLILGRALIP